MGGNQFAGKQQPQVAALTNKDGLRPMCDCQLPLLILSRINASRVALSGIRNNASARHISATPSCDDSENSCNNPGPYLRDHWHFLITQFIYQLIRQFMRLFSNWLRQAGLFQQHRNRFGFRAAIGRGDRGAGNRLGQNLLGKVEERLVWFLCRSRCFIALIDCARKQRR